MALLCCSTLWSQAYFGYTQSSPSSLTQPHTVANLNNLDLQSQEETRRDKHPDTPVRFAVAVDSYVDIVEAAEWESTDDGKLIGRYRLTSPQAQSINLHFSEWVMPVGTQMILYNPLTGDHVGPFTHEDNEEHQALWSPIVFGDDIIIELVTTVEQESSIRCVLSTLHHDFAGFHQSVFKQSGSCNIDVACGANDGYPQIENFRQQIKSVGAYHFNGTAICTGAAINNTAQDCKPYFLTAHHCGITQAIAPSMVVYWNYENSYCRPPNSPQSGQVGDGSLSEFNMGAVLRASSQSSDFTLVELDDPIKPEHDVYLSGWNRSSDLPQLSVCIHHPGVEEKRISFDYEAPIIDNTSVGNGNALRVLDWDLGTTEDGSSGAPLFNEDGLIVGQLLGGYASCHNDEWDAFGWFYKSWDGSSASSRLSNWLDPINSGELSISGHSCAFALDYESNQTDICKSSGELIEIKIVANSAFANETPLSIYDNDGLDLTLSENTIQFELPVILRLDPQSAEAGDYQVVIRAGSGAQSVDISIPLSIFDGIPSIPGLVSPIEDATEVSVEPELRWTATDNTSSYEITVAEDEAFDKVIGHYTGVINNAFTLEALLPNTTYYWKVASANVCGVSDWSDIRNFSTGLDFCTVIYNTQDLIIPETEATVFYPLDFPYPTNVKSMEILNFRGRHSWIKDLLFWIKKENQKALLWQGQCPGLQDFSLGFSLDSQIETSCPITDGRIYRPAQTYVNMIGMEAQGKWEIEVADVDAGEGGYIDQASVKVCFDKLFDDSVIPSTNTIFVCAEQIEFDMFSHINDAEFIDIEITDANNQPIPYTASAEPPYLNDQFFKVNINSGATANTESIILKAKANGKTVESVIKIEHGDQADANAILIPEPYQSFDSGETVEFVLAEAPVQHTEIQVALDPAFNQIILSELTTESTTIELTYPWVDDQQYYVRTLNYDPFKTCLGVSPTLVITGEITTDTDDIDGIICDVNVFPNPATDMVNISLERSTVDISRVRLIDFNGSLVASLPVPRFGQDVVFSVEHMSRGIYILEINLMNGQTIHQKVLVQ